MNEIKSQGTEMFFIVQTSSEPELVKLNCPTEIPGLGKEPADQIDSTCLDDRKRAYLQGLRNSGSLAIPFIYKKQNVSHQALFELEESGDNTKWLVVAPGDDAVTLDSNGDFAVPASREAFIIDAYVSSVDVAVAGNDVWRGTLTLQTSGEVVVEHASA